MVLGENMISNHKFTNAILGMGLLVVACNNTESDSNTLSAGAVIGIWKGVSRHKKGTETTTMPGQAPVTENQDFTNVFPPDSTLEFKADGTLSMNFDVATVGTWSISGNKLTTITSLPFFLDTKDTSVYAVTITGKEGVFVQTDTRTYDHPDMKLERNMVTTLKATKQ
jgi:hypothetical protein